MGGVRVVRGRSGEGLNRGAAALIRAIPSFRADAEHRFYASCVHANNCPNLGRSSEETEAIMMKGGLLWLLGIPLPIILLLWFFGVFH